MAQNDNPMNENHFWMVWIEGKSGPTKKHSTIDEARLEAERLLRLPGNERRKAHILEAGMWGMVESPPITWRTV